MRIDTKTRQAGLPCSFDEFVAALGHPQPALAAPPHSLRRQIAARPFAAFDNVFSIERSASTDMAARVARFRAAAGDDRPDVPMFGRDGQTTGERRLAFAIGVTAAVFGAWVIIGLVIAYIAGRF